MSLNLGSVVAPRPFQIDRGRIFGVFAGPGMDLHVIVSEFDYHTLGFFKCSGLFVAFQVNANFV
ncbi:MAG TPA: hypothetical protein VMT91_08460 [Anaerolineales bacterium]|nr:hypothetical protein [Anaerolineales bacterium]